MVRSRALKEKKIREKIRSTLDAAELRQTTSWLEKAHDSIDRELEKTTREYYFGSSGKNGEKSTSPKGDFE